MKQYYCLLLASLLSTLSLIVTSCQDDNLGFTEEEVFQGAYKRNFEKLFGKIDPDQNWDLSSDVAGGKSKNSSHTRAEVDGITLDNEGYYRVQPTTLKWIDDNLNSITASNFVFRYNYESLTFIPIRIGEKQGDWSLKLRLFQGNGTNDNYCSEIEKTIWSRTDSQVQETKACETCKGTGSVPSVCSTCQGNGTYSQKTICHDCGGNWESKCPTCTGIWAWVFNIAQIFGAKCWTCGGAKKIKCNSCVEGYETVLVDCQTCGGSGIHGTTSCSSCDGTGGTLNWANETKTNGTTKAVAVRAKRQPLGTIGGGTAGDVMYPYLYKGTTYLSSIDGKFKFAQIPRPSNITNCDVFVLACETGSDKDYKDLVFLVVGNTAVPKSVPTDQLYTTIKKRYLIEDLGSTSDFDFNDIVVDVEQTKAYNLEKKNRVTGNYQTKLLTTQKATLKHTCGTLPFQVKVGDTSFNKVTDPTDGAQIKKDLGIDGTYSTPAEGDGVDLDFSMDITGWDNNNISIKVWKKDGSTSEGGEVVGASFPQKGAVPFIIATDISVGWTKKDGETFKLTDIR